MDLKFYKVLTDLLPQGKFWEVRTGSNIEKLYIAVSQEFSCSYKKIKNFFIQINILRSYKLSKAYANDYLINTDYFTDKEIQFIIVKMIYKSLNFRELIDTFIDEHNLEVNVIPTRHFIMNGSNLDDLIFSESAGNTQGYIACSYYIDIKENDCLNYNKIKFLCEYFKPAYMSISYSTPSTTATKYFMLDTSFLGDKFENVITCSEARDNLRYRADAEIELIGKCD